MTVPVTTSTLVASGSNYLAAEYLVRKVGEAAAQVVVITPTLWYQPLMDLDSMKAHYRVLNPLGLATAVPEATQLPLMNWTPTGTVVSAGLDGFSVVESKVVDSIAPEVLDQIGTEGGKSLGRTVDSAAAALFPGFTGGTFGATGTALTIAAVVKAEAALDAQFANGPKTGILHPQAFGDLKLAVSQGSYGLSRVTVDATGDEVIIIGSITFHKSTLVPTANSGADYVGAIYVDEAIGLAMAQEPQVEILPIPGQHAWSVDCTVAFGVGLVRPNFGVVLISGINA
jgi:hypothetical protein